MNQISAERMAKYFDLTRRALAKVEVAAPERSHARRIADDFLAMAKAYLADAEHNHSQGNDVDAFAQINYAHAWLDAGARFGLFDVGGDDVLFTLAD